VNDKKILVVVDPTSDEQPAVDRAAWLAERMSASIELLICDYDPEIDAGVTATVWIDEPARENLLAILREKLDMIAAPLRERGLDVSVDVSWDHPLDAGIVRKIKALRPWLVVKDTHHHTVLQRTILSNTDWQLIRECPAPLLLVKPQSIAENPKILAAVDPLHVHDKPAALDNSILSLAKTLAEGTGGELHAIHTYLIPIEVVTPDAAAINQIVNDIEREHRDAFKTLLERHSVSDDMAHLERGMPHERLPAAASRENAGIVVMGAVSRRGLDRVFIGSTAERILERLPCDVLIVKSGEVS
jgi:universal stress protein E